MSAGTSPATTTFIRPDGREKVTGVGRYTADLATTGMAHARFRYADHPHARVLRIDTTRARALPGVVAWSRRKTCPRSGSGARAGPNVVRQGRRAVRGRDRGGCGRAHRGDRRGGREADRGGVRATAGDRTSWRRWSPMPRWSAAWASYERDENMVSNGNTLGYHTIVKGDAEPLAQADVVVREQVRVRSLAGRADRAARRARRVAGRRGHDLVLDAGSLCRTRRCRADLADPEANVRVVAPGRGFGAKCDLHFEAQVAALARAARRPVRLVFSARRSSGRSRSVARGS